MVKKSVSIVLVLFLILISIFSVSLIAAEQTQTNDKVANAYNWLINQVKGKWQNLNTKQHVFSLLALSCNESYFKPGNASLYEKSFSNQTVRCWGMGPVKETTPENCLLTETALAKMALDFWKDNTTKVDNWLLSRTMIQTTNINWFLQIDIERDYNASCEIIYGNKEENVFEIAADKKVSITGSSECFFVDPEQPYWFAIKATPACYSNRYTIKCWSNATIYRASLLYKKPGSATWHVSSETQSGKPGVPGSTRIEDHPQPLELQVQSYCLSDPGKTNCNYEGTAWTAYALKRVNDERANMFIPYLVVFAEENSAFFPESFLYSITTQERYSNEIIAAQKIVGTDKGYWLIQPVRYGRVYDTAHASLALGSIAGDAITKAKNYLLANQEANGNLVSQGYGESGKDSIRDSAFALWVFWLTSCPGIGMRGFNCIDMGPNYECNEICDPGWIQVPELYCEYGKCCKYVGTSLTECQDAGGYCKETSCNESEIDLEETLGIVCPDYNYCCKPYSKAYCNETGGEICDQNYSCLGREINTLDGKCCLGSCVITNANEQNCLDIGTECEADEVCINRLTWQLVPFTTTADSTKCCVGSNVKCVKNELCSNIGKKCANGEECKGSIVETKDTEECCQGNCVESCSKKGGVYCLAGYNCKGGHFEDSSEGPRCCVGGNCKKPANLSWLWIVLIIIIIAGALFYFLKIKKKKKPKEEKPSLFGMMRPTKPMAPGTTMALTSLPRTSQPTPLRSIQQSIQQPVLKSAINQKANQKVPMTKPLPKPLTVPKAPTPTSPTSTMPASKTLKQKSKTESELEKTLKKLKKMTKK